MGARHGGSGEGGAGGRRWAFSPQRLERVLENLPTAVTVSDEAGRVVYANPSAVRLAGYASLEEMLDTAPTESVSNYLMLDADGAVIDAERLPGRRVASGGSDEADQLLHVVNRRTGERYWWQLRSSALSDDDASGHFAVTIVDDVTAAKEAEERQAFLARAGEVLGSSLDYAGTLRRIAELAVPTLADWCGVDILDERGLRQRLAVHHTDAEKVRLAYELDASYPPDPAQPVGVYGVMRHGRPELYPRITDEMLEQAARDERHLELVKALGMRSVILAPMTIHNRTIGVITLVSAETERIFDEADLEVAMELARRAAVAVENARLYTSRTEASRMLQQTLLPERLTAPPGWSVASFYRPGDDLNEVGGDFFDLVTLGDGSALAFVGDVTGKGVRAAALTSLARHTLEVGARFDARPSRLMRLLEDVLTGREDAAPITVAAVRVTPTEDGAVAMVTCAGHPPPLLLRPGEEPEFIGRSDIVLGAGLGGEWREVEVELRPGDTLVLYTDGITDTPGSKSRFGEPRLLRIAADGPLDPASVVERVHGATAAWQSGTAVDDRAMLVLQLEAPAEVALEAAAFTGRAPD